jgi:hypothetical protein
MRIRAKMTYASDSEDMLNRFLADFRPEDIIAITQHAEQVIVFYRSPE